MVKKNVLMLVSRDIDTINNSDIYDTYKDLYLSEKKHEEAAPRYIVRQWVKSTFRCKKGRWHRTNIDN